MQLKKIPLLHVKEAYKKLLGARANWNFYTDIPELEIIAGPLQVEWNKRVKEEIRVFDIWKRFNPAIPFRNLRNSPPSSRKFQVEINIGELFELGYEKWIPITILIPLNYPKSWPSIGDPRSDDEFFKLLRNWTHNHPFCMPPILRAWWTNYRGRAGIAHFLQAFLIFITIAGRKSHKKDKKWIINIDVF